MSRVDRALEVSERRRAGTVNAGGHETAVESPPHRFHLNGYARENITDDEPPATPAPPSTNHVAPPAQRIDPSVASVTALTPDLQARLVNGGSGAVPLEQYRRLAAVLHDLQKQQGLKTLMLTSALPAEGKTLTAVNLALTLSESFERRVLLIDADLRWPSVHKMFGLVNDTGLSEALQVDAQDVSIRHVSPNLSVLTAGRVSATPLAALTSMKMAALLDQLAQAYDWVLLDTPPVGLLPDAQPLARLTRAVVFVIAAGATPQPAVQRAISELGADCIIGTVLNRVDERQIPAADYYHSRYGSREN